MGDEVFFLAFVLPLVLTILFTVVGGVLVVLAMKQRGRTLEMKHRERLAMIERGLAPAPGSSPAAFEEWQDRHQRPASAATTIGVVIVALGLAFAFIVGFAGGEGDAAIGIGGAIVVLGAAFIINGILQRRPEPPSYSSGYSPTPRPPGPLDPPRSGI